MKRIQCLEQSRAEQSRAEQSRAEQSRAEQLELFGNVCPSARGIQSSQGRVWNDKKISPCLDAMQGGNRQPHIVEVKKMDNSILGNLQPSKPHHSQNVYDINSVAPTIMAGTHGYGMGNIVESRVLGGLEENSNQRYKIYDAENIAPTLQAAMGTGGGNVPLVADEKLVFEKDMVVLGNYMPSNHDASRVVDIGGVAPTVKENHGTVTGIVDVKEIIPSKPSIKIRQATKDGFIECELPGVADLNYASSTTRRGRVIEGGQISPTLTTENIPSVIEESIDPDFYNFLYEIDGDVYLIRIRKLIPKECWALMDFNEGAFERASQVNSNTQLYKQAGNSIVTNVLVGIFGQMLEGKEDFYKEVR